jgi:hypothetical protein
MQAMLMLMIMMLIGTIPSQTGDIITSVGG